MDSEKIAHSILKIFSHATLDKADIERIAWWVKYLGDHRVLAKVIYFCERILNDDH